MFCPRCGNNLLGSEEFCPKCGQDLKQARSYNVSISLTKEQSKIPFWRQKKIPRIWSHFVICDNR